MHWNLPRRLADADHVAEEGLDLRQALADDLRDLIVVGRKLERGVNQQATVARALVQDRGDDAVERPDDGTFGRAPGAVSVQECRAVACVVLAQRPDEKTALVAEGGVDAGAVDAHAGDQVLHGSGLVAARPEGPHGLGQDLFGLELLLPGHGVSRSRESYKVWNDRSRLGADVIGDEMRGSACALLPS